MRNTYYIHQKLKALKARKKNLYKRLSCLFMDDDLELLVSLFENNPDLCLIAVWLLRAKISSEDLTIFKSSLNDALKSK